MLSTKYYIHLLFLAFGSTYDIHIHIRCLKIFMLAMISYYYKWMRFFSLFSFRIDVKIVGENIVSGIFSSNIKFRFSGNFLACAVVQLNACLCCTFYHDQNMFSR